MVETLETARLRLRQPRPSDAGPISLHAGDVRLAWMTASIPHPYPPGAAEAFIAAQLAGKRSEDLWVMDATPSGGEEMVGLIGVKPASAELGYWVGPPFWSTGYATEAVGALLKYLLREKGFDEVTAAVFEDNPVSTRVLLKNGFREACREMIHSVARGCLVSTRRFRFERSEG